MEKFLTQCLLYDFTYENVRYKGEVVLDEDTPNLELFYDDHSIEVTWVYSIRHKGKHIELSIVINDDANAPNEVGKVVASAWVCVYSLAPQMELLEQFEPEEWAYVDEQDCSNNVSKDSFYQITK